MIWPDRPLSIVEVRGESEAVHLELLESGLVVSVLSLFIEKEYGRFRKFAPMTAYQRKRYGTTLLRYVFDYLKRTEIKPVSCNSRIEKGYFYASFSMSRTGITCQKEQVEYVVMEKFLKT